MFQLHIRYTTKGINAENYSFPDKNEPFYYKIHMSHIECIGCIGCIGSDALDALDSITKIEFFLYRAPLGTAFPHSS